VLTALLGYLTDGFELTFSGDILLAHATMDRVFGYGLKFESSFHSTPLGEIGNREKRPVG
jgi:hypothetical protein